MPLIPTLLAIAVVVFTLIEATAYARQGAIKIAPWAWLVLITSLVFSFPFSLVSTGYLRLADEMIRGQGLAFWITNSWRNFGALFALNWLVVFKLLKATKGVVVLAPEIIKHSKRVLTGALAFCTLADAGVFLLFRDFNRPQIFCTAASPDGSMKAMAGFRRTGWFMLLERNIAYPILGQTVRGTDSDPRSTKPILAWSKDSKVVSLWFGSIPVSAYDLKEGRKWQLRSEAYRLSLPDNLRRDAKTNILSILLNEDFEMGRFLANAVERGDVQAAKELIANGGSIGEKVDGSTMLQLATRHGQLEMVKLLLAEGADPNVTSYSWGGTALASAADRGYAEITRELLARGASIDAKNMYGTTALMMASRGGHRAVVQVLLDAGADVNAVDNRGQTALFFAELQKHKDVADGLRAHQKLSSRPK